EHGGRDAERARLDALAAGSAATCGGRRVRRREGRIPGADRLRQRFSVIPVGRGQGKRDERREERDPGEGERPSRGGGVHGRTAPSTSPNVSRTSGSNVTGSIPSGSANS